VIFSGKKYFACGLILCFYSLRPAAAQSTNERTPAYSRKAQGRPGYLAYRF
jgi:hypothetical protein